MPRRAGSRPAASPAAPTAEIAAANGKGQPPADADPFVELARLVVDLDRKDELLTQLGKRIEPLKPLQMVPVGGEIDLHQSLVDLLQRARGAIRELVWSPS